MAGDGSAGTAGTRSSLEVERKFDVDPDLPVPEVEALDGIAGTTAQEHLLEATYYDTDDLRLRAAGITLRHRTGGTDAGWHLKLPAGRAREEISLDAGPGPVPGPLAALVRSRVRSGELRPVAVLSTRRVARRLLGPDGTPLAELADDTVVGRPLPAGPELLWREWEVELLDGDEDLLQAVSERFLQAGATPAAATSKLGRVLPRPARPDGAAPQDDGPQRPTAGDAVRAHLAEQVAELVARDPHTRRDAPDALHKMRVATRRLRSALATFRPLLDAAQTDPLRDELRWLAGVLGAARDAEVMHDRLRTLVEAEPSELVLGDVRGVVEQAMTRRHRAAHDRVLAELDGDRYLHLLDALDALATAPPFLPGAHDDAEQVLRGLVRRTWHRLDKAMTAAEQAPRGPEKDEWLHEVRKEAKRSRYAAEAVVPVFEGPARRYAEGVAALQESLGDFQDGVVTRAVLLELVAEQGRTGADGFTLGRLHALEQVRAEAAVDRWPEARAAVSRRRLRRWLDD